jgi:hypothetical protein
MKNPSIKKILSEKLPTAILLILVAAAIGFIGSSDYENELNSEHMYCEMVKEGTWQDFNHNYKEICNKNS